MPTNGARRQNGSRSIPHPSALSQLLLTAPNAETGDCRDRCPHDLVPNPRYCKIQDRRVARQCGVRYDPSAKALLRCAEGSVHRKPGRRIARVRNNRSPLYLRPRTGRVHRANRDTHHSSHRNEPNRQAQSEVPPTGAQPGVSSTVVPRSRRKWPRSAAQLKATNTSYTTAVGILLPDLGREKR